MDLSLFIENINIQNISRPVNIFSFLSNDNSINFHHNWKFITLEKIMVINSMCNNYIMVSDIIEIFHEYHINPGVR